MLTSARPGSSSEETRARIIAAAKAIYESNGTRGTTTRLVAERAGVNEATLFRHFGSKQALLAAMRESACPATLIESTLASLSGDLREELRTIAYSLVEHLHTQRAMICISMAEDARADAREDGGPPMPEWRGPIGLMRRVEGYFRSQIDLGRIRGDAKRLAGFFMGMCFQYVFARKIWNSTVINRDDLDFMVDIFLNGVR